MSSNASEEKPRSRRSSNADDEKPQMTFVGIPTLRDAAKYMMQLAATGIVAETALQHAMTEGQFRPETAQAIMTEYEMMTEYEEEHKQ